MEYGACEYRGMHVYITGFSLNPFYNNGNNQITFRIDLDNLDEFETGIVEDDINIEDDIFQDGLDIRIRFSNVGNSKPRFAQLSMVFVGVREHDPLAYPIQSLFVDDFRFNAIYSENNRNVNVDLVDGEILTLSPAMFNNFYYDTTP